MSICSSISGDSGIILDDECFGMMSNTGGSAKNNLYSFAPSKHSRTPPRSRPGVYRSDHTSASVQNLELDDSCASFSSFASTATTTSTTITGNGSRALPKLSRKEGISPRKKRVNTSFLDLISCDASSNVTSPTKISSSNSSKTKNVQFAPISETLYIPVLNKDEMTQEEIENTWYTKKDYEIQRASYQEVILSMEEEVQKLLLSTTDIESTSSVFITVVKTIDEARGLEHRTKEGLRSLIQNRKLSIHTVLQEQESVIITHGAEECTVAVATAYSMTTLMSMMDAMERAVLDAKEAGVVVSDHETLQMLSLQGRDKCTVSESCNATYPLSNASQQPSMMLNHHPIDNDSMSSLSPKRRGYKPRPLPQRQPSLVNRSQRNLLSRNTSFRATPQNGGRLLSRDTTSNVSFRRSNHHPPMYRKETSFRISNALNASSHSKTPVVRTDTGSICRRGSTLSTTSDSKQTPPMRSNSSCRRGSYNSTAEVV